MMDNVDVQDPQVPAGFTAVDQGSQDPPPPPGFAPVTPPTPPPGQQAGQPDINPVQPPDESDPVENFKRQHPWSQIPINLFQGAGAGALGTLRNIDELGNKIAPDIFAPSEIPESVTKAPPGWAGKIGHFGEQLGEFFLPAGKVGEVNKAIDASVTAGPWVKAGAKAVVEATPAYAITLAQTGDPVAARNAALTAGGVSVVLPQIGKLLKNWYGAVTGVGADVIERVAEKPTPDLMAAMTGQLSEKEILDATRQAVGNLAQKRSADYIAKLNQLDPTLQVDLTPTRRALNDLANSFRIRRILNPQTQKVELDFGNSHLWSDPAAQQQITTLWDKIMSPMAQNPRNVDALKRGVDAMYGESSQARAVIEGVRDKLADSLNRSVPGYQDMTAEYAKASDFLAELKDLSLQAGKTNNDGTAMRKLFTSLKQNNDYRKGLLEELTAYTPRDLPGMVAGNRMSSWTPRGIVAALHAAGTGLAPGVFLHAAAHDPAALAVSLASIFGMSPRIVGEIAARSQAASRLITTGAGAAPSMLHITGQQPDYDANVQQYLPPQKKGGYFRLSNGGAIRMDGGGALDDNTMYEGYDPNALDAGESNRQVLQNIINKRQWLQQHGRLPLSSNPGQSQMAKGGAIHMDDGGYLDPNDPTYDPDKDQVLRDIERKRRFQLGYSPSTAGYSAQGATVGSSYDPAAVAAMEKGPAIDASLNQGDQPQASVPAGYEVPVGSQQTGLPGPARPPQPALPVEMSLQQPEPGSSGLGDWINNSMAAGAGTGMRGVERLASTPGETTSGLMQAASNPLYGTSLLAGQEPELKDVARGTHEVISGGMQLGTPLMLGMAGAPGTAVKAGAELGTVMLAQNAVDSGLRKMGVPDEFASVLGDITGFAFPGALKAGWESLPSKAAMDNAAAAARARLMANHAFEPGMTSGSGAGGMGQNILDTATLLGAKLGSGVHAVGDQVAARSRQIQNLIQQSQQQQLSPQLQEQFAKVREANPEINAIGNFMLPLEIEKMLASPKQVESMARMLRVLPEADKMTAMALAGAPKLGWYRGSAQALTDVFGEDAPRFAQLLAATSPRISVEKNLLNALNIWKNWTAEGRPQNNQDILRIMAKSVQGSGTEKSAMDAWRNNTYAALTSKDPMSLTLSGPKVDSFQHNLRDHVFHVTNDAWMANAYNVAQDLFSGAGKNLEAANPGMTTSYGGASAQLRAGAAQAGMFPSQGQETIWSVAMQLYELARQYNTDPRNILQRHLLDKAALTKTPDFSTLLRNPEYAQVLQHAGYGQALEAMQQSILQQSQHAGLAGLTLPQQNLLMQAAGTINDTMSMRDRESRAAQFAVPRGWEGNIPKATTKSEAQQAIRQKMLEELYPKTATGVTNLETVPGETTGHQPAIAQLPASGREHYTSTVYGDQQDLAGRDIIQNAALGPVTIPSQNVQGAYLNARGRARLDAGLPLRPQDIESHPGRALGYETPLEWHVPGETPGQPIPYAGRWEPRMNPQAKKDLEGSMAAQALVNAQEAVGSNVVVPTPDEYRAKGNYDVPQAPTMKDFVVPLEKRIDEDRIRAAVKQYPRYAFASAPNHDMHVLGLGADIKYADAMRIQKLLGGESFAPGENVGTYVDMADKWNKLWGSREVTGEVLSKVNQMSSTAYSKLDQDIRQVAGDTFENYKTYLRTKKTPPRPDLMNALDIVSKYGLQGLQAAYNNKAFLPGIAAAILLPPLLKSASEQE